MEKVDLKKYHIVMTTIFVVLFAMLLASYVTNWEVLGHVFKEETTNGADEFTFWGVIRLLVIFPLYVMSFGISKGNGLFSGLVLAFFWSGIPDSPSVLFGVTYLFVRLTGVVVLLVEVIAYNSQSKLGIGGGILWVVIHRFLPLLAMAFYIVFTIVHLIPKKDKSRVVVDPNSPTKG